MNKYHVFEWNTLGKSMDSLSMVILNEEAIESKDLKLILGFGFEILVLPLKYIDDDTNDYVNRARAQVKFRVNHKIIYV